jgi:hypothetical protein
MVIFLRLYLRSDGGNMKISHKNISEFFHVIDTIYESTIMLVRCVIQVHALSIYVYSNSQNNSASK